MKRHLMTVAGTLLIAAALGGALGLLVASPGCTTPMKSAYHTVDAVTLAVDLAMGSWATLSVQGRTTPDQDQRVRALYGEYQQTMMKVEAALTGVKTNRLEDSSYAAASGWAANASAPLIDY